MLHYSPFGLIIGAVAVLSLALEGLNTFGDVKAVKAAELTSVESLTVLV